VTGSRDESGPPFEVDRYHCSGSGIRAGKLVVDVPVGMLEPVERATSALARLAERVPVELHVGVVLEEDVHRLVVRALELLPVSTARWLKGALIPIVAPIRGFPLAPFGWSGTRRPFP
jgi:hypothetical protein